jgi:hypothetical protein
MLLLITPETVIVSAVMGALNTSSFKSGLAIFITSVKAEKSKRTQKIPFENF